MKDVLIAAGGVSAGSKPLENPLVNLVVVRGATIDAEVEVELAAAEIEHAVQGTLGGGLNTYCGEHDGRECRGGGGDVHDLELAESLMARQRLWQAPLQTTGKGCTHALARLEAETGRECEVVSEKEATLGRVDCQAEVERVEFQGVEGVGGRRR